MDLKVTRPLEGGRQPPSSASPRCAPRPFAADRIVDRLAPRHRHAPGDRADLEPHRWRALRLAARPGAERRADDAVGFPIISVVLTGGDDPSQLRDFAFYQLAPRDQEHSGRPFCRGGGRRRARDRSDARPESCWPTACPPPTWPTRSASHRCSRSAASRTPPLAYQVIVNTQGARRPAHRRSRRSRPRTISRCGSATWPTCEIAPGPRAVDRLRKKDAVVITVFRSLGGNTINVSNDLQLLRRTACRCRSATATNRQPRNIQATVVYDQARFIETRVDNVRDAILIGGLFSILILLAVPAELAGHADLRAGHSDHAGHHVPVLALGGETLNLMSLGGLGGGHRPHHRRYRRGHREHCPPLEVKAA